MAQMYVLVQTKDGALMELVLGEFEAKPFVGQVVQREQMTCGYAFWEVLKVFEHEERNTLFAIDNLIGHARLTELFKTKLK